MKKARKPSAATKLAPKRPATKPLAAKPKTTAKPAGSDRSTPEYHSQRVTARAHENLRMTKQASATKASSPKPKPRNVRGQAELTQVVAQLALSAEKLAQAADRLTKATLQNSQTAERRDEAVETPNEPANDLTASLEPAEAADGAKDDTFKTLSESIAERTASEEHPGVAGVPDSTTPEQSAETADGNKDG
jgi:hypothetical protein